MRIKVRVVLVSAMYCCAVAVLLIIASISPEVRRYCYCKYLQYRPYYAMQLVGQRSKGWREEGLRTYLQTNKGASLLYKSIIDEVLLISVSKRLKDMEDIAIMWLGSDDSNVYRFAFGISFQMGVGRDSCYGSDRLKNMFYHSACLAEGNEVYIQHYDLDARVIKIDEAPRSVKNLQWPVQHVIVLQRRSAAAVIQERLSIYG